MGADFTPLTGELLGLDLVNTHARSGADSIDHLATSEGLRAWIALEAERLLAKIRADRHFDGRLFLSQAEFDAVAL